MFIAKCIVLAILLAVEIYLGVTLFRNTLSDIITDCIPPYESQMVDSPFDLPWETIRIVFFVLLGLLFLLLISLIWDWIHIRRARADASETDEIPAPLPTSFVPKTIELYPLEKDITKTLEIEDETQDGRVVFLQEIESEIHCEIIT